MKKLICLTITLIMLLSCFVVTGSAETAEQAYPDIVITPDNMQGSSWTANKSCDTLSKDTDTFGETVYKLTGGASTEHSGDVKFNLKNIPYDYKYVKVEVYYENVSDTVKTTKPFAQISEVSASPTGDAASAWKNMTSCSVKKLSELCGSWETLIFSMDYSADTTSGYLEGYYGGGYLRQMTLSLTGWKPAQDCVVYIRSLTFVKETVEVMKSVGVQSTLDYGETYTISAESTGVAYMSWNSGGVETENRDGVSAWKMVPKTGSYDGEIRLYNSEDSANASIDYSKYKYVTYYMYVDSAQQTLELNPTLQARVSPDTRVDQNADGTYTGSKQSYPTNEWVKVTIRVSDDFTKTCSDHMLWPTGCYTQKTDFNCVYISAVTFSERLPEVASTQSLRFISVLKDSALENYYEVGYKISAKKNGVASDQVLTVSDRKVYTSVLGAGEEYTPESFGGTYFTAIRLDDVPIGEALELTVIAYVKAADGRTIEALPVTYKILSNGILG